MNEQDNNKNLTYLNNVKEESFSSTNSTTSIRSETYEQSTQIEGKNFKIIEAIKITRTQIIQIIHTNLPGDRNNTEAPTQLITGDGSEEVEKLNPEKQASPENDNSTSPSLIKFAIGGLICYVLYESELFLWGNLFLVWWVVGLINPKATATVSKLYTTLIALAFLLENQYNPDNFPGFSSASWFLFNILQYKVLVVAIAFSLLLLINRDGVILGRLKTVSKEGKNGKQEEFGRFEIIFIYLFLAIGSIIIVAIIRLMIGLINFVFQGIIP